MKWFTALALAAVTAVVTLPAQVLAADAPKKCYLLFPIRTELQRKVLFDENERYLLLIHGDSLITAKGQIHASRLDFRDLDRDIGRIRIIRPGDTIRCDLLFARKPPHAAARLVNLAAVGWARERCYERHVPCAVIGGEDWKNAIQLTKDARGLYEEKNAEDAVGGDTVKAYPVRTGLS